MCNTLRHISLVVVRVGMKTMCVYRSRHGVVNKCSLPHCRDVAAPCRSLPPAQPTVTRLPITANTTLPNIHYYIFY